MANQGYNIALKKQADALLNFGTADIRALLLKTGYVFSPLHQFVADLTPGTNELSVSGYSRKTLANKATSLDNTNNRAVAVCDPLNFGDLAAGQTLLALVLYVNVTNDADSWLLDYIDTGGFPKATNGRNFTIQLPSNAFHYILGS
jgi:hypothetical protein